MRGEIDAIDFVLAQDLGMPLGQVRALPNAEIAEWRAYYEVRHALENMTEKAKGRRSA